MRFSNNLVGILNFVILLLSIPILAGGIWLSNRGGTDCEKFLDKPMVVLGVFLLVVSLAGLIGACCRVSWLLWIYLFVMFILIVVVVIFTIFAFIVTNKGAGQVVSERGYKEYRLGDYSNWLQKRMEDSGNWNEIRSCIQQSKVCQKLADKGDNFQQFVQGNLSPLQSGCCKPPTVCNFEFVNATYWNKKASPGATNPDCDTWSNDQSMLCYDCQSCKAGILANFKADWKKIAIVNIIFLIFLIIVYSVGCCAFRNNRNEHYYEKQWGRHP